MKIRFKLSDMEYYFNGEIADIAIMASLRCGGSPIDAPNNFCFDIPKDPTRVELESEMQAVVGPLQKDKEQYSRWWIEERAKTAKLEKELADLKSVKTEG